MTKLIDWNELRKSLYDCYYKTERSFVYIQLGPTLLQGDFPLCVPPGHRIAFPMVVIRLSSPLSLDLLLSRRRTIDTLIKVHLMISHLMFINIFIFVYYLYTLFYILISIQVDFSPVHSIFFLFFSTTCRHREQVSLSSVVDRGGVE